MAITTELFVLENFQSQCDRGREFFKAEKSEMKRWGHFFFTKPSLIIEDLDEGMNVPNCSVS